MEARYKKGSYYLQIGIPDDGKHYHTFIDDFVHVKAGSIGPDGKLVLGVPIQTVEAEDWCDARTKFWVDIPTEEVAEIV